MTPIAAPAKRPQQPLSESTLVPLGFVFVILGAFFGMAKWVGTIDAQQAQDRQVTSMMIDQLKALTTATMKAGEEAASTRARVEMIVRELDRPRPNR